MENSKSENLSVLNMSIIALISMSHQLMTKYLSSQIINEIFEIINQNIDGFACQTSIKH